MRWQAVSWRRGRPRAATAYRGQTATRQRGIALSSARVQGAPGCGSPCRPRPSAIALVQLRDGCSTDGMLVQVNEVLDGLGKPPLTDVQAADVKSVIVGVAGKMLKRRLRQEYAATALRSDITCLFRRIRF